MNAPEGFSEAPTPYRFTWPDILRMADTGIIEPSAHVELIDGELLHKWPPPDSPPNAEAPFPYLFTWDEVLRMADKGIIDPDAHVELIGGELIQMSPQSVPHIAITQWLAEVFILGLGPKGWKVTSHSPAVLDTRNAPEPDLYIFPRSIKYRDLKATDLALVIEVAHSSLKIDLDRKAKLYASFGVREYWVIDVKGRSAIVHRSPRDDGYASIETVQAPAELSAEAFPEVRVSLADLPTE